MTESDSKLVLVTGVTGFLGSHVAKALLCEGYRVRGTVRSLQDEKKLGPVRDMCEQAKENLELVEADLLKPETWEAAVKDCEYVHHVASPFPSIVPRNHDDVIKPAVEGTLNVLKACAASKTVKRVVLTSSCAAIGVADKAEPGKIFTEEDWLNTEDPKLNPYEKSKALAEKAAVDFVKDLKDEEKFELAVINPGLIIGPMITATEGTSATLLHSFFQLSSPLTLKVNFPVIDVRDVAQMHLKAMTLPEAVNHRCILVSNNMWLKEMGHTLKHEFGPQGYAGITTAVAPRPVARVASFMDKRLKLLVPLYGKELKFDNKRMKEVMGLTEPIPGEKSVVDMAYSMIDNGLIKKTKKYKGHPDTRPPLEESKQAEADGTGEEGKGKQENGGMKDEGHAGGDVKDNLDSIKHIEDDDDLKKPPTIEEAAPKVEVE